MWLRSRGNSGVMRGTGVIKEQAGGTGSWRLGNASCCGTGEKVAPFWQTRQWVVVKQRDFATLVFQI